MPYELTGSSASNSQRFNTGLGSL